MLFQALTGRVPFPRDSLARHALRPPRRPAAVGHRARARGAAGARRRDRHRAGQGPGRRATRPPATSPAPRSAPSTGPRWRAASAGSRRASSARLDASPTGRPRPTRRRAARRARGELEPGVRRPRGGARAGCATASQHARPRAARQVALLVRRARHRQDAAGGRARPRGARRRRDRALRPQRRRVARPLPAVRDRASSTTSRTATRSTLPAELEPELAELARLVPALRRHLPDVCASPLAEDGETRRYRLFEAVTRVLAYAAARGADRAHPRRPAVGGHLDRAAARAPAAGPRARARCSCSARSATPDAHRAQGADRRCSAASHRDPGSSGRAQRARRRPRRSALVAAAGPRRDRLVRPAPARGHRRQPVLHQGDAAQPGRGGAATARPACPCPRASRS